MLPSALTRAWLALGAPADLSEQPHPAGSGPTAEATDVVWRYDTGG